ncbi:DUF1254 domain-containing protein [Actinomycetospora chiangmaiensis]|uniref:DUF1254 domain-containing protein n=1 Tax=Actinomycetospora chiangmaiensis TaxID=402650 RepID=UPI000376B575|nr:DUF1254 domain-containing protein [Actinomycetospora chiangmaiensis]
MNVRTHDTTATDVVASPHDDLVPRDPDARRTWCTALGTAAVVYGTPAALQYAQFSEQILAPGAPGRLAEFVHERTPAGPEFRGFRAPNVDTLYSNAWLDLRGGPAELRLPEVDDRYLTVQVLDAHSNATNLNSRTHPGVSRFWLVSTRWDGEVPADAAVVRVGTDLAWLLLRIQVLDDDVAAVHRLQDAVRLSAPPVVDDLGPAVDPEAVETDWRVFYRALDAALRLGGVPESEWAHVRPFAALGLLGPGPWDPAALDEATADALADSFAAAQAVLRASRPQLGESTGTGWTRVRDKGAHGHNFLARAVMNHVGLEANLTAENTSFNTHVDATGDRLRGRRGPYRLAFDTPPPADAFWSLTLDHVETGRLYANVLDRYGLGSASLGTSGPVAMTIAHEDPGEGPWLPCPEGDFYLILRLYAPGAAARDGRWLPTPVTPCRRRADPSKADRPGVGKAPSL